MHVGMFMFGIAITCISAAYYRFAGNTRGDHPIARGVRISRFQGLIGVVLGLFCMFASMFPM